MNISLYPNIKQTKNGKDIPMEFFLDGIKLGTWQDQVFAVHNIEDETARRAAKERLPYVTVSGKFSERNNGGLIAHSGLICIDIDKVENVNAVKETLKSDKHVYACFVSASGRGLAVIFKINPDKHREAFDGLAEYLFTNYGLVVDQACKDVSRPRYVSYDPYIYVNIDADKFAQYQKKEPKAALNPKPQIFVQSDFDEIVNEINARRVDITGGYHQWVKCGFAIADKFGEGGRHYFHIVSQHGNYDEKKADEQYTACVKARGHGVGIASFYYLVQQKGIPIISDRTRTISQHAALSKKNRIAKGDAIKQLQDLEGIPPEDSADIVNQVYDSNIKVDMGDSPVEALEIWLRQNYEFKRNSITRYIHDRGRQLDDTYFNTVYIAGLKMFEKLRESTLRSLIYSDFTASHNPLIEYLEANKERQPSGAIAALFNTIETDTGMGEGQFSPDYAVHFGTKWVIGIIASIYGYHSVLMLVLSGGQNTGKTEFFRRLLPKELKEQYFSESKLDQEKDAEILMCQKLLIMDDEMGGKSKKDSARLKALTSADWFSLREPYGRANVDLKRLAVLCGTTNMTEILNDPTGNRRTLPINVMSINHDAYNAIDKVDVLMEAYHLYHSGFNWRLTKEDIRVLGDNTSDFVDVSSETELINRYFEKPEIQGPGGLSQFMTASDIKAVIHARTGENLNKNRIGIEMRKYGWTPKGARPKGGESVKGYWVIDRGSGAVVTVVT